MYILGSQVLGGGYYTSSTSVIPSVTENYDWMIKWYHKSGGLKKVWYWGINNSPIQEIEFEINKKLMGNGSIKLTNVDFLIHSFDRLDFYYLGEHKYRGYIDSLPDPKGGKLKLIPLAKQLEERVYNSTFSSQTVKTMLQDIIQNTSSLDVLWTSSKVNITDVTLHNRSFKYTTPKKAIEDLMDLLPNSEWGIDELNFFNVYKKSTTLSKIIVNCEEKYYKELEHETNDDRIKATRYQVFVKSTTAGQSVWVGQVGYNTSTGSYPQLAIETLKRRKDDKYEVSFVATTTYALNSAYNKLTEQAELSETVNLKKFRYDEYDPDINTYIKVIDDYEKVLFPLKNISNEYITDSTSYWTNITLSSTDYVQGSNSVCISGTNPTNSLCYFDFGENKRFANMENFCFMVKSQNAVGKCLYISFSSMSSSLFTNNYGIYINDNGCWEMKSLASTVYNYRYIGFKFATTYTSTQYFWIDDLNIYSIDRNEYDGNVVQKKYTLNNSGVTMDLTLNDYSLLENNDIFDAEKAIENIKEIQLV